MSYLEALVSTQWRGARLPTAEKGEESESMHSKKTIQAIIWTSNLKLFSNWLVARGGRQLLMIIQGSSVVSYPNRDATVLVAGLHFCLIKCSIALSTYFLWKYVRSFPIYPWNGDFLGT